MYLTRSRVIAGVFLAIVAVFIVYLFIVSISRSGKTGLSFTAIPKDTVVTIDGNTVKGGTKIYLNPGTYTYTATKDGFKEVSQTINLQDIERSVSIALTPESEEAKKWAKEHESEYLALEGKEEKGSDEISKRFIDSNPIIKDLPYKTFIYSIGHHIDPADPTGNSIIIDIDAPEGYRQDALFQIRQMGYDPTDFNINFRGYNNPFPL